MRAIRLCTQLTGLSANKTGYLGRGERPSSAGTAVQIRQNLLLQGEGFLRILTILGLVHKRHLQRLSELDPYKIQLGWRSRIGRRRWSFEGIIEPIPEISINKQVHAQEIG